MSWPKGDLRETISISLLMNIEFMIFLTLKFSLAIIVPRTELIGDPDRYVKTGSTVIFRCIVRGALGEFEVVLKSI